MASIGHNAAFELQAAQQDGNAGDFVAFFLHRLLAQTQTRFARPGSQQMHRVSLRRALETAPQGFAINGNHLARHLLLQIVGKGLQAIHQPDRIQQGEHPAKSIVTGDAMGQIQMLLEPVRVGLTVILHVAETISISQGGKEGDDQNVDQRMLAGALHARIVNNLQLIEPSAVLRSVVRVLMLGHPLSLYMMTCRTSPVFSIF